MIVPMPPVWVRKKGTPTDFSTVLKSLTFSTRWRTQTVLHTSAREVSDKFLRELDEFERFVHIDNLDHLIQNVNNIVVEILQKDPK
jgi:hypothetical protein